MIGVSIDPGVHKIAVAHWYHERLIAAVYLPLVDLVRDRGRNADVVFVEMPVIRTASSVRKSNQMDLAYSLGTATSLYMGPHTRVTRYFPSQWKGTLSESVTTRRILEILTPTERATLEDAVKPIQPALRHNVYDAVGVGLFGLGRALRGCVKP